MVHVYGKITVGMQLIAVSTEGPDGPERIELDGSDEKHEEVTIQRILRIQSILMFSTLGIPATLTTAKPKSRASSSSGSTTMSSTDT